MKRLLLLAALLANFTPVAIHTAKADSFSISTPGLSIHLGDRDRRGYYWDGGRWRDPRWWNDRYRYDRGRWWRHEEWRRERERDWRAHERWREHRHWERERERDRRWHDRHGW